MIPQLAYECQFEFLWQPLRHRGYQRMQCLGGALIADIVREFAWRSLRLRLYTGTHVTVSD
jgi:hypothetical protein